ncbi:2'-5' RNA ligase family protein [Hymenobacter psychrotolerans]|uniref:2'-5' RNA ligase n=1 Tax=Hymenobacter psychrotolerans DSM 18569 TaxID=1121959 RepID=A0A1M6Y553_9BACT|nr:2'-5' RNA ligase family protein [Hymenobacter psychrotolerans]SHL13351.1 2'-5' RNA ligase [Hymenobacter psychrotolerans DSM 18569]
MLAITSLLNQQNAERINRLIKSLETEFGLDDVQATPDPHITYQLAGVRKLSALKQVLRDVARSTRPFVAHTTGLGVFPGPNPVIYIPVLRSNDLNLLHQRILQVTAPLCLRTDKFSGPDCWLPHISLALHDTTPELLGPVMQYLNRHTFNLKLNINNLAILRQEGELFVQEKRFAFEGHKHDLAPSLFGDSAQPQNPGLSCEA